MCGDLVSGMTYLVDKLGSALGKGSGERAVGNSAQLAMQTLGRENKNYFAWDFNITQAGFQLTRPILARRRLTRACGSN